MIYLMNSAVMPAGNFGLYRYEPASLEDLKKALQSQPWESRMGYQQNCALLARWLGMAIPLSREATQFSPGDKAWVMRLKTRVTNPATKGVPVSEDPADWEFAWITFLKV